MTDQPEHQGTGPIHIAGAGTIGMYLLVASLSMLFAASMFGYIFIRFVKLSNKWPPAGYPPLPASLWISTIVILASSVTIQFALSGIKRNNEKNLKRGLILTAVLGMAFLIMQTLNWVEFASSLGPTALTGQYISFFYMLTGLHAAHVIGGLIPLGIVTAHALAGRYSANFHPGVRYCAIYWHFLDAIWVSLFVVLYLI